MTVDGWDDELTLEFAREIVARVDEQELALFDAMLPELERGGVELRQRSDGSLGFGVDMLATAQVSVEVAKFVGLFLVSILSSVTADAVGDQIKLKLRKTVKRDQASQELPADAVDRARDLARDRAIELGLDASQAGLLADAVRGALTTPAVA